MKPELNTYRSDVLAKEVIAGHQLETVRLAGDRIGLIASPTRFGKSVTNDDIMARMTAFESSRMSLYPDKPISDQLSTDTFQLLQSQLSFQALDRAIPPAKITLRQAIEAKVVEAATLAGINKRWVAIESSEQSPEPVINKSIAIGVRLLQEYKAQFGMEPEGLILTSSFLPENMAKLVITQALNEGVLTRIPKSFEIRLFCAGSASAMAVALSHPEYSQMSNVAVLALEPISALTRDEHFSMEHFQSMVIFSDEFAIMKIEPRYFRLSPHSVITALDDHGVIQLAPWYNFPDKDVANSQQWLEPMLASGQRQILRLTDQALMVQMRSPADDEPPAVMRAMPTARFFGKESAPIIEKVLREVGYPPVHVFNHEPSSAVIQLVQRRLVRQFPDLPALKFHGVGNSSSSTMMRQIIEWSRENPSSSAFLDPTLVFAPGAGAVFAVLMIESSQAQGMIH